MMWFLGILWDVVCFFFGLGWDILAWLFENAIEIPLFFGCTLTVAFLGASYLFLNLVYIVAKIFD